MAPPDDIAADARAADAAVQDAGAAAASAANTSQAAELAGRVAIELAETARSATAEVVAAAATSAAEVAAATAVDVQQAADSRAAEVAALRKAAENLSTSMDSDEARRIAADIAARIAADVVAQARLTDEAAARVARVVSLAAEAAALAALAAASLVESAADDAAASAQAVSGASARTESASDAALESIAYVAELTRKRMALLRRSPLVTELSRALVEGELNLHYQPIYRLEDRQVVAVEALMRWEHPTRGLLPPITFLDVAEGPHLLVPIGDWVVETAVAQGAAWQATHGDQSPTVWINVSCDQLGDGHLVAVVERCLASTGLAPERLGLELTERQLARRGGEVAAELTALRSLGVKLAVDDFGTGYASIDYVRRFTFDEIKIDRAFISGAGGCTDRAVMSSIVALADALDIAVVAEGIETEEQYERVRTLGCALGQGYLLHRPVPVATVTALLAGHEAVVAAQG